MPSAASGPPEQLVRERPHLTERRRPVETGHPVEQPLGLGNGPRRAGDESLRTARRSSGDVVGDVRDQSIDRASSASNGSPVNIAAAMRLGVTRRRIGTERWPAPHRCGTSVHGERHDRCTTTRSHDAISPRPPATNRHNVDGGDRRLAGVHQPFR
jgi:hypothetical protein